MIDDIYQTFETRVTAHESRPFVRTTEETYTYGQLADRAETFATQFREIGLEAGDIVGFFLPNSPAFVAAYLGAVRQGITVACLNTSLRGESLTHLLDAGGVETLLSTDDLLEPVADTCTDAGVTSLYSVTADSDWAALPEGSGETPAPVRSDDRAIATLVHTSGTTGLPKWCELSHAYLVRLGEFIADGFEISGSDTVFNPLPLYHINPLGYYLFGGLTAGATLGMVPRFSVSQFWQQVHSLDVTVLILHMAPKDMIVERTTADDAAGHDVRVMFPADETFMQRYDVPKVVTGYGSTEAGGLTHLNKFTHAPDIPTEEDLSQVAGYPRRDVEVTLVDDDGYEVPQGTNGEIRIRPRQPGTIFSGYRGAPENTLDAWEGLWYNTGDIGYLDEAGALHFVERKADSITHKGEFVNVDLVETLLESHPAVTHAFVVGEPDDVVGERVKAAVRTADEIDPAELIEHVASDLPAFMIPEFVDVIDRVPRLEGTEKVDRTALRERSREHAWRRPD
ncbi:MAG: class I adenylate-forming enzyme family protein [Halorientalis sp.]